MLENEIPPQCGGDIFWNDVCLKANDVGLRPMMLLTLMMCGFATFYGKHRIIAKRSGATSFLLSKYIISSVARYIVEKRLNLCYTQIKHTALFFDDYDVLCATDCDKNKSVEISAEIQIKCTNGVDAFITEDDSGKPVKRIVMNG